MKSSRTEVLSGAEPYIKEHGGTPYRARVLVEIECMACLE